MNEAGVRAIRKELVGVSDNLERARMQRDSDPDWKSGNGQTIDEMIAVYERQRDELAAALTGAEGEGELCRAATELLDALRPWEMHGAKVRGAAVVLTLKLAQVPV